MSSQSFRSTLLLLPPLALVAFPCISQVNLKPGLTPLSRQELKACILRDDDLKVRDQSLRKAGSEHDADTAAIGQEAKQLAEIMRAIDPADQAAVDEFNRRNDERNRRVEVHNKRTEALNSTQAELQAARADYMSACLSRPYISRDKESVLKELGRAQERPGDTKPKGKSTGGTKSDA